MYVRKHPAEIQKKKNLKSINGLQGILIFHISFKVCFFLLQN